ncbi:MAG: lysophospholipid acyltransferase family protein [Luteibaculaceae bacterium]
MPLIDKKDFITATQLDKFKLGFTADFLMRLLKLKKLNSLYDAVLAGSATEKEFLEHLLLELKIEVDFLDEEIKNIPEKGPFIIISNHPFGMLDGIILLNTILSKRSDFKVLANFLLQKIQPIKNLFLAVNPFDNSDQLANLKGIKEALYHLDSGGCLGIFPAGEVSTYQRRDRFISDRKWHEGAVKLVKKAKVPVIPVYFEGANSFAFHLLGKIHPLLRTASIPREFFNKKNKTIRLRVGSAITQEEIEEFENTDVLGRYLRSRTYLLNTKIEIKHFYKPQFKFPKKPQEIIKPIDPELLKFEIGKLTEDCFITESGNYQVYLASAAQAPNVLLELGRLREETFRAVGEGTNRKIDVDEFDLYFKHLFIWDKEVEKLVGAYRIGLGDDIMSQFGSKGFYISSLFDLGEPFKETILPYTIELGRSFVAKEFQQKPLPLFLLWKGLMAFILSHKNYRYVMGPVSISGSFSSLSKSLIVEFIKRNHYDAELAKHVVPKNEFKVKFKEIDPEVLAQGYKDNITKLDKFISNFEPEHFRIPVLLKKYIKQNAKILAFNIDPAFNDSLDGLMMLDMQNLPEKTISDLSKELNLNLH